MATAMRGTHGLPPWSDKSMVYVFLLVVIKSITCFYGILICIKLVYTILCYIKI